MPWDKGWNFRATATFVTDGTNETYELNEVYPVTRNGVTFGWVNALPDGARDRDSTIDRRLAGMNFKANNGGQERFRVDLPAAGAYTIRVAAGESSYDQLYQYYQFLDNTTVLRTVDDTNGVLVDNYDDATGVNRTEANWPSQNAADTQTFATTIFFLRIGAPTAQLDNTCIAHLFLSQQEAGGYPAAYYDRQIFHNSMMIGG